MRMFRRFMTVMLVGALCLMGVIAGAQSGGVSGASQEKQPDAYKPRELGKSWKDMGVDAWSAGDNAEAAFWYRKWLEASPQDNHTWYNLACIYAVMGMPAKALDAMEAAVDAGWNDAGHCETDPDFESIRGDKRFSAAVARIREAEAKKQDPDMRRRVIEMVSTGTYVAYLPPGFDSMADKSKLRICLILHGNGSTETGHGGLSNVMGREHAVYIAPRAPYVRVEDSIRTQRAGYTLYPETPASQSAQDLHPFVQYADFVQACVDDARGAFGLSKDTRLHVLGHSMGGAAALVYACRYNGEVAECFIHAGFVPGERFADYPDPSALGPRTAQATDKPSNGVAKSGGIQTAGHVKFTVSHCTGDPIVAVDSGKAIVAKLAEHGITAKTMFMEAESHGFVPEARAAIQNWIKGQ